VETLDDDSLDIDGQYPSKEFTNDVSVKSPAAIQREEGNWDALTESFSRNPSIDGFMPLMTQQSAAQLPETSQKQLVTVNYPMKVHTSKLFEEGFTNPKMAQSEFVQDQITQLHEFEKELNRNPSNSSALINFVQASKEVS
jgi:hypothetical protein